MNAGTPLKVAPAAAVVVISHRVVVLHCGQGTELKGFQIILSALAHIWASSTGLDVVDRLNLAADGQPQLLAHGSPARLGQMGNGVGIISQIHLAATEDNGRLRPVLTDLSNPLVLYVV